MKRHEQNVGLGDLNDLIVATQARTHRPRITPREAGGQALQSLLGGLGAGVAVSAVMAFFGAPWIVEAGLVVAAVAGGSVMFVRSCLDEWLDMGKLSGVYDTAKRAVESAQRQAKESVEEKSKRLAFACTELDRLEAEVDERDVTIARLLRDHELTQLELARLKDQLRPKSWTPAVDPNAGVKADAMEIVTYYFQSGGKWYSRVKAEEAGWTAKRHAKAQAMLIQAGVMRINVKQPQMLVKSLDEATDILLTYTRRMAAAGVTPRQEEADDDNE